MRMSNVRIRSQSFSFRMIFAMSGMIALSLLVISGVFYLVQKQKSDAYVINQAGKLRMLSQKMAKYSFELLFLHQKKALIIQKFNETVQEFDNILELLLNGDSMKGIAPAPLTVQPKLQELKTSWDSFKHSIQKVLIYEAQGDENVRLPPPFKTIYDTNEILLSMANEVVYELQKISERRVKRLIEFMILAFILVIAIGIFIFFLVRNMVNRISRTSTTLASVSTQILHASRTTLQNTQNQASAVQETAASASELQQTVQATSVSAQNIMKLTEKTADLSNEIVNRLDETKHTMNEIRSQLNSIETSMRELTEKHAQIGEIAESVSEIADQTQLLAINASIEAAKAGKEGRGFSVVATEMKNLAEQSKQSTQRVRAIIHEVQDAVRKTFDIVQSSRNFFDNGIRVIEHLLEEVSRLTDEVDRSNEALKKIHAIVNQQKEGIEQIHFAMQTIQHAVHESINQSKELEKATESLNRLSKELKTIIQGDAIAEIN